MSRWGRGAYLSLLRSCVANRAIDTGTKIHARLVVSGAALLDNFLGANLVTLYCVCDQVMIARKLFDEMPQKSVFAWNALIRCFAWNGPYPVALDLYFEMLDFGLEPDNFTLPFVLKACSQLSAIRAGLEIHEHVRRVRLESDVFIAAALVDMYGKCGCVEKAREVFDETGERDGVLWNSMISAYSQNGQPQSAMSLFSQMLLLGFWPTVATIVIIISASADIANLPLGRAIHTFCWRRGFDCLDKVKIALVDMYAKSGALVASKVLFEGLKERKVVSWNAMIAGYAMHGFADEAIDLFKRMTSEKVQPDHVTFVGVLSACNHARLLDKGQKYFDSMIKHLVEPRVQHYTCMVGLLGHCGKLNEAYNLILQMKVVPDSGIWGALLSSCKMHKNLELGEVALEKLIELEPDDAGNIVLLSNMYAQAGKWDKVAGLRKLMTEKGLKKVTACSWIEVKNKLHGFLVGNTSHPQSDEIYDQMEILGGLMREAGYVPDTGPVFHDVEDDEKMRMVNSHSERLAIAFGLISTPPGTRLLITKNIRVCDDCHSAIKFISRIVAREIIVRDVNRYHHFKDGVCSCKDYW